MTTWGRPPSAEALGPSQPDAERGMRVGRCHRRGRMERMLTRTPLGERRSPPRQTTGRRATEC
eukprot:15450797-Alexandrium_andersonii.AAC.1